MLWLLASVAAGAGPYQDLSLENATEVAAKQGKRVAVVFVTSDKFSSCLDDALALPVLEGWRSNQVVLVRVEIEKERTAARLLGVTSVPTLVLAGPSPQSWVGCPDAGKMGRVGGNGEKMVPVFLHLSALLLAILYFNSTSVGST